ncbi:BTB/POZ domain-containing protein 6-A-like [Lucilia sericata]|uniref:BTB/POZ domain-containing protein 6-A-like n=1 Tax=Lucilia sericata TaxID=13632 RepID=UPI0018A7E93F|nr:BTB/POZ domain-containing protein 6-A-like [Lucilia sericata]
MDLEGIKKRNWDMLQSEKFSDCSFLVGLETSNQKIFAAHKLILATASPVFEAMFYGDLAEKSYPIPIPDIQPDIFQDMLKFIYSDCFDISSSNVALQLCAVGKKYLLVDMVKKCCDYIYSKLNWENACEAYEFAVLYDEKNLKRRSMENIAGYAGRVLAGRNFTNIKMSTLLDILDKDYLNIPECELYNVVLRFPYKKKTTVIINKELCDDSDNDSDIDGVFENEKKIKEDFSHLEGEELDLFTKALKKVRYLSMTPTEFAEGPANSPHIKPHEGLAIFKIICSPYNDHFPVPEGFCGSRRRHNARNDNNIRFCVACNLKH